jgi:hypothetical protein
LACYYQKIEGVESRRKYRIRGYGRLSEDPMVYLEIKRKHVDRIDKNRAQIPWRNVAEILADGRPEKYVIRRDDNRPSAADARSFLYYYHRLALCPTLLVVYEREAYQHRFERSLRLTFDVDLRSALFPSLNMLFDADPMRQAIRDYVIMEVKFFGGLPAWVRSVVERYQLPRLALSKYTICLDTHWSQLRRRHGMASLVSARRPRVGRREEAVQHV